MTTYSSNNNRSMTVLAFTLGAAAVAFALMVGLSVSTSASALNDRVLLAETTLLLDSANERSNFCAGGLEDGKIIVNETFLRNGFKETTVLACQVDGGKAVQMPDLPAPDARATKLA